MQYEYTINDIYEKLSDIEYILESIGVNVAQTFRFVLVVGVMAVLWVILKSIIQPITSDF